MIRSTTMGGFVGYSLVIGGAVSNLIDRFMRGAVFDFIHFHYQNYSFPVFNLADCFITIGVLILVEDCYSTKKIVKKKRRMIIIGPKFKNSPRKGGLSNV